VVGSSDDRTRCGSTAFVAVVSGALGLLLLLTLCLLCRRKRSAVPGMDKASVLRQSLLGGSGELPENILAEKVRVQLCQKLPR
jgi:hypothetical protein